MRPTLVRGSLVAVLALVVAASGCGGTAAGGRGAAGVSDTAATAAADTSGPLPELRAATADQVLEAVRAPGADVVLVNVWATWCAPCREEFPELVRLGRDYRDRGLRLVLVSADFDDQAPAARAFLRRHGVDFVSYLKTGDDMKFIDALSPQWTGALPATILYDRRGRRVWFHEGKADYATFERQVLEVLHSKTQGGSTS